MKKFFSLILALVMTISLSVPAFAAENPDANGTPELQMQENLNEIDLSQFYTNTSTFYNEDGEPIIVTVEYEPTPQARGSSTNEASVGTWTSKVNYGIISMSYKFDLTKSGSQWKMSNARNHEYSGLFCSFEDSSLTISRAVSTNTFPCEINARVDASVFDNAWIHLYSGTWIMSTTVNSSGTMTLTWN